MSRGAPRQSGAAPRKRSVTIAGHATSLSLEEAFWDALKGIAAARGTSTTALIAEIDAARDPATNLSSAVRVFVLHQLRRSQQPQSSGS